LNTTQTGTRHRTAERTAEETNLTVITVSEESSLVKVFTNSETTELEEPSVILGRVNESLHSVDRMRRRFDDAVAELGELEIENSLSNQQVLEVIQRGELLTRLAKQVRSEALRLGGEAGLVLIQIDSLESGVTNTLNLVLKDHLPPKKYRNIVKAIDEISRQSYEQLNDIDYLGSVLGKLPLDDLSTSKGYRVLARLPNLPENLHDSIIQKFKTLPKLLSASPEKLYEIEGIGRGRAQQLRNYFDTLLKNIGFSYINGH
jgi:diadenylate cyclase